MIIERGGVREGLRERERDRDVREKHLLAASCTCPNQVSNPQPSGVQDNAQHTEPPSQGKARQFFWRGGHPVHCRVLSSNPDLHPFVSSSHEPSSSSCDNQKWLQMSPNVPCGAQSPPVDNYCCSHNHAHCSFKKRFNGPDQCGSIGA